MCVSQHDAAQYNNEVSAHKSCVGGSIGGDDADDDGDDDSIVDGAGGNGGLNDTLTAGGASLC